VKRGDFITLLGGAAGCVAARGADAAAGNAAEDRHRDNPVATAFKAADWRRGGFAANAPGAAMGSSDGSTSQLVQAMAGFDGGGGATDSLNAVPLGADTSQQRR
jgi:hypothetical protein